MKNAPKKDFTPSAFAATLVTIEAVFAAADCREMDDVIDTLRQYGYAVVVKKQAIAETFDEACKILQRRAMKPSGR